MPQVTYLVEFAGDAWWIDLEGKHKVVASTL